MGPRPCYVWAPGLGSLFLEAQAPWLRSSLEECGVWLGSERQAPPPPPRPAHPSPQAFPTGPQGSLGPGASTPTEGSLGFPYNEFAPLWLSAHTWVSRARGGSASTPSAPGEASGRAQPAPRHLVWMPTPSQTLGAHHRLFLSLPQGRATSCLCRGPGVQVLSLVMRGGGPAWASVSRCVQWSRGLSSERVSVSPRAHACAHTRTPSHPSSSPPEHLEPAWSRHREPGYPCASRGTTLVQARPPE